MVIGAGRAGVISALDAADLGAQVKTTALTTAQENSKFSEISIFESLRRK
jgi:pyruvate/2-oxoglutarate dehydrogenase complex dihydrolipoamide dehydrogenase (E3) component